MTQSALKVVEFLRANSLDELSARYFISVKRHPEFPSLCFLKYDQISSPMAEPIVQECRGLILDESDDWRVVSFPFKKFFNSHESHAHPINWAAARVFEKLDGSLMTLYFHAGAWRVASNGLPDAGGPVNAWGFSFAQLFWKVWFERGYCLPPQQMEGKACFVFELLTPYNRVVVRHDTPRLVLIGARSLEGTLAEYDLRELDFGWEVVRTWPLRSLHGAMAAAKSLNPLESEGFVVCDDRFNRVKVKSPAYVAIAHAKDSATPSRLLDIIRLGEQSEWLAYFPEMRPLYERLLGMYESLCAEVDADFATLRTISDQKQFALLAVQTRCSSALFAMRKGSAANARQFFASCSSSLLEKMIDVRSAETRLAA